MARLFRHSIASAIAALLLAYRCVSAAENSALPEALRATVTTPDAAVRSGPGDSYYLTETLPQDSAVEIYRRQPDGWCAIRPTAESFSWVYSPHVRLLGEELAEVNKNDVAARVGSRLSSQRDVVQVRLEKGEVVQIVGQDERDGHAWYKIAPPAGEFRWIHAQDLAIDGAPPIEIVEIDAVRPASHEVPATASNSDQWTAVAAPPLAPVVTTTAPAPTNSTTPSANITPVPPVASSADLAQQLTNLELQLSRMVAEPMASWSIESLERTAEQLLSRADTVADREAVKATLAKIDRFAALQRRSAGMNGPLVANSPFVNNAAPAANGLATAAPVIQGQVVAPMARRQAPTTPSACCGRWSRAGPALRSLRSSTIRARS